MIIYSLLVLFYSVFVTIVVFKQFFLVNIFIIALNFAVLKYYKLSLRKITASSRRLTPFVVLIILTSGFFTNGQVLFTVDLLFTKLSLTLNGLKDGLIASSSFIAIASVTGFYHIKRVENSLAKLSEKIPLLAPFFIAQKYIARENDKKTAIKSNDKFILRKKIDQMINNFSTFAANEKIKVSSDNVIIIGAVSVVIFSLKIIRILPAIPFASGQKLVLIIPLQFYVSKRLGGFSSTVTALNYSFLSLVFGQQGQLGIIDILRSVILGLGVDVFAKKLPKNKFLLIVWLSIIGGFLGFIYAFLSVFLISFLNIPSIIYLFLGPRFISNVFFGALSGSLSYYFVTSQSPIEKEDKKKYNRGRKHDKDKSARQKKAH